MTTPRRFAVLTAVILGLALPFNTRADDEEYELQGKIQQVETDGRLRISGGHTILVDEDTEVLDNLKRPATARELTPGIEVEVTYETTSKGDHAKRVIATMLR